MLPAKASVQWSTSAGEPITPVGSAFAQLPHLLAGKTPGPVGRLGEALPTFGRGRTRLTVVLDLEADLPEQAEPVGDRHVELDAARINLDLGPVMRVHPEVRPDQPVSQCAAIKWRADVGHGVVSQEDEPAAAPEQAVCLGNPQVRIAPDGRAVLADREVEAAVVERSLLGVAVMQLKIDFVLGRQARGCEQLLLGVVDAGDGGTAPCHPGGDVAGSAAQFDRAHALHVGRQHLQLGLRHAPYAPDGLREPPLPFARGHPFMGVGVPVPAVLGYVPRQIIVLAHCSVYWSGGKPQARASGLSTTAGRPVTGVTWTSWPTASEPKATGLGTSMSSWPTSGTFTTHSRTLPRNIARSTVPVNSPSSRLTSAASGRIITWTGWPGRKSCGWTAISLPPIRMRSASMTSAGMKLALPMKSATKWLVGRA